MIIIRKRVLYIICAVFIFAGAAGFVITKASSGFNSVCVIVDAGHGEPDGGAVGVTGVLEKDINLQISNKLSEVLEGKNFDVLMTRTGDNGIYDSGSETIREKKRSDMKTRLEIMKNSGADLFISIHMNSFENKNAHGLNVFYSDSFPKIKPLAEEIQKRISEITGAETHAVKAADETLYLMKNPPIPTAFISRICRISSSLFSFSFHAQNGKERYFSDGFLNPVTNSDGFIG